MRFTAMAATAAATLLLAACGGSGDDDGGDNGTPPVAALTCDTASMSTLSLPGAAVTAASAVAAGSYTPPGGQTLTNLPAFCRVDAKATPTSDSLINFQVWVPEGAAWNGKLVVTGNGGYSPSLSYGDMAYAMRQGYAVVGGDTGHQSSNPNEMFWGVGHPEKIRDWGSRSIHAITEPSKQAIAGLRAQAPEAPATGDMLPSAVVGRVGRHVNKGACPKRRALPVGDTHARWRPGRPDRVCRGGHVLRGGTNARS